MWSVSVSGDSRLPTDLLLTDESEQNQIRSGRDLLSGRLLIPPPSLQSRCLTANLRHLVELKQGVNLPQSSSGMLRAAHPSLPPPPPPSHTHTARKSHEQPYSHTHTHKHVEVLLLTRLLSDCGCFEPLVCLGLVWVGARPRLAARCLQPAARHCPAESVFGTLRVCGNPR